MKKTKFIISITVIILFIIISSVTVNASNTSPSSSETIQFYIDGVEGIFTADYGATWLDLYANHLYSITNLTGDFVAYNYKATSHTQNIISMSLGLYDPVRITDEIIDGKTYYIVSYEQFYIDDSGHSIFYQSNTLWKDFIESGLYKEFTCDENYVYYNGCFITIEGGDFSNAERVSQIIAPDSFYTLCAEHEFHDITNDIWTSNDHDFKHYKEYSLGGYYVNDGYCKFSYCINCQYVDFIKHTHNVKAWIIEPTCTTDGLAEINCSSCLKELGTSTYSQLNHNYDELGNCLRDDCGYICPHDNLNFVVVKENTCLEYGEKYYHCEDCGYMYHVQSPSLGHDFDEYGNCRRENCDKYCSHTNINSVYENVSCTEKGVKYINCLDCQYKTTVDVNPLGHDLDIWGNCKREGCQKSSLKDFFLPIGQWFEDMFSSNDSPNSSDNTEGPLDSLINEINSGLDKIMTIVFGVVFISLILSLAPLFINFFRALFPKK